MTPAIHPAVYRMFNADGALLYVGCSVNPPARITSHRSRLWFGGVVNITVEHFADRHLAEEAERVAIETEGPLYNGTPRYAHMHEEAAA